MRVNREIRAREVRVIGSSGEQVGVLPFFEAIKMAEDEGLDLVEVVPTSTPPVCKVMDYGKFKYDQTKKEKENKKAQHQIKVKELKVKPNIDDNDLNTKKNNARKFLEEGNKVKLSCVFRGREMMHTAIGEKLVKDFCTSLEDISTIETPAKLFGKMLTVILAPGVKKKKEKEGIQNKPFQEVLVAPVVEEQV